MTVGLDGVRGGNIWVRGTDQIGRVVTKGKDTGHGRKI